MTDDVQVKAVVLVGGPSKGTRFRPLSIDAAKPLFPIASEPLLSHHLNACKQLKNLKEIILIGFYETSEFETYIEKMTGTFGVPVRYLKEPAMTLGTGGGLYYFRKEILANVDEQSAYLLVLHSDIFCSFPLAELLEFHLKHKQLGTIMGKKVPREQTAQYGCIVEDAATHEVTHYVEKPETFVSDLVSCGIYLFTMKNLFARLEQVSDAIRSSRDICDDTLSASVMCTERGNPFYHLIRLEQDLLRNLASEKSLFVYETSDWWMQVKNPEMALVCNEQVMTQLRKTRPQLLSVPTTLKNADKSKPTIIGNVIIHPTARIDPTAKIGPNVCIEKGVVIGKGVRIKQSIILDNVEIRDFACIMHSIVGWNSVIGRWSRLEGIRSTQPQQTMHTGLTILGKGVTVGSEIIVRSCVVLPHKELSVSIDSQIIL